MLVNYDIMTRAELLRSPEYWITKVQIGLFSCAEMFMKKTKKNRSQLAQHLGVSKGYVSQVLNGDYDHRLSKFMELSLAFGYVPRIEFIPIEQVLEEDSHSYVGTTIVEDSLALAHYNNAMSDAYEICKQVV